jgi:hypothetical protein
MKTLLRIISGLSGRRNLIKMAARLRRENRRLRRTVNCMEKVEDEMVVKALMQDGRISDLRRRLSALGRAYNRVTKPRLPLLFLLAFVLTSCTTTPRRLTDAELLRYMPPGATIEHRNVTDYGVTYRARFVILP